MLYILIYLDSLSGKTIVVIYSNNVKTIYLMYFIKYINLPKAIFGVNIFPNLISNDHQNKIAQQIK